MNWEEACSILGIVSTASEQEILEQYRYKVQLLHPDWNSNKPTTVRRKAEQELMQVNEAYSVLKNSRNRSPNQPPKIELSLKKIHFKEVALGQKRTPTSKLKAQAALILKSGLMIPRHPGYE
jgi:curved DNA-binding protein CbpA